MEQNQSHEAAFQKRVDSVQHADQARVESAVAAQERTMQFTQHLFSDWLAALQDHADNQHVLLQEMEQQSQKQQEAFQTLVQQSVTSYFDALMAGLASFAPTLRLTEKLQLCLGALGNRTPRHMRPWSEVKSRRGAPKHIETQGFACPNQQCVYFGITDAHIHALVGDGKHGHAETIQTFRCQACHTTFSARRDTSCIS